MIALLRHAEHLADATGTAHALVEIAGVLRVLPVIDCLGLHMLEVVRPLPC